ncbi:hypothetical protein MPH_12664, partial [Macrophomina phaseolina MS6]
LSGKNCPAASLARAETRHLHADRPEDGQKKLYKIKTEDDAVRNMLFGQAVAVSLFASLDNNTNYTEAQGGCTSPRKRTRNCAGRLNTQVRGGRAEEQVG